MARSSRKVSGTGIYHVVIRGNNQEEIFKNNIEKKHFLNLMKESKEKNAVQIYAYCVMSNHVHIMLQAELENLVEFMRNLNTKYAVYYNKKYSRCGHVFQGRYYSDCIETEEYFWCCLRYIHNNPVKIHLVSKPFQYQYSSSLQYKQWYDIGKTDFIDENAFKMLMIRFPNQKQFWEFHKQFETHSFKDTAEDIELEKNEKLTIMLQQFMKVRGIENPKTILAIAAHKREFIQLCKEKTGIPGKHIDNFLKSVVRGDRLCRGTGT